MTGKEVTTARKPKCARTKAIEAPTGLHAMAKKKAKRSTPQKQLPKEPKTKPHRILLAVSLGASTLLGGLVAILALMPRVLVEPPSNATDVDDAFSVSFDVVNANFIPLRNIGIALRLGKIISRNGAVTIESPTGGFDNPNTGFFLSDLAQRELQMDERFTVRMADFPLKPAMGKVTFADMIFMVSYNPWFLPIRRVKEFRFFACKEPNTIVWHSWPLKGRTPMCQ
ncbi:MAG: hypothetical protein ABSH44_05780 [Bryobacteraceae bacterium]